MAGADLRTHYPKLPSIIPFTGKRVAAEPSSNCAKSRLAAMNVEKISVVVEPARMVQDIEPGMQDRVGAVLKQGIRT
jgi:hypothetical protein